MTQASVLVVEDNDLERQITADTLREEGFAVEEAARRQARDRVAGAVAFRRRADGPHDAGDVGRGAARESARRLSRQPGGGADRPRLDRQRRAGDEGRRVRLPREAHRSRETRDQGGQGGGIREPAAGKSAAEAAPRRHFRDRGHHRTGSRHPGSDPAGAPSRAVEFDRPHPRRERDRQGNRGQGDPSAVAARGAAVRRDQLLGDSRQSDRERTVRP